MARHDNLRDDDDMLEEYGTWTGYAYSTVFPAPPTPREGWQLFALPRPGLLVSQLFGLVRRIEPATVQAQTSARS